MLGRVLTLSALGGGFAGAFVFVGIHFNSGERSESLEPRVHAGVQTTPSSPPFSPSPSEVLPVEGIESKKDVESYDAVHLNERLGIPSEKIFEEEHRDHQWASRFEAAFRKQIDEDLKAMKEDAQILSLECRYATCKILMETTGDPDNLTGSYPVPLLGNRTTMDGAEYTEPGKATIVWYIHLQPQYRDHDAWSKYYASKRALWSQRQ